MIEGIPAVSVVMPLYNKACYVARAIQSVLNQTCPDFELIVVDDGSTDDGVQVVESFADRRIRPIKQANAGVSAARNRGIAEARADLIAFLDADDEWRPDFLRTVIRLRNEHPECGAYGTAFEFCRANRCLWVAGWEGMTDPPGEGVIPSYFRAALSDQPLCSSSVAVPKWAFAAVGTFPEGEWYSEDMEMWCRIALRYPIAFSSYVGARYHRNADGAASQYGRLPLDFRVIATVEAALRCGRMRATERRSDVKAYASRYHIACAENCLRVGLPSKARAHLLAAASTWRFRRSWTRVFLSSLVTGPIRTYVGRLLRFGRRCLESIRSELGIMK